MVDSRPFIFLSYAHAPTMGGDGQQEPDPDFWVHRFFSDLCQLILQFSHLGTPPEVGFMDRQLRPGEPWSAALSDALARCRVSVPLYAPRYFRSVNCGQEWQAFAHRPVYPRSRDGKWSSGIVPVLWIPQDQDSLPRCASQLQYKNADFGWEYATEGMFALSKFGYFHDAYEFALLRLARQIVSVAKGTMIPVDEEPQSYPSLPSAFETADQRQRLRISVLAGDRSRPPPGRSDVCYGPTPRDWQPYEPGPQEGRSLAEHAARLAEQLDFQPTIHVFDDELDTVLGSSPTAPEVLLFDRWALLNPVKRRLAKKFDQVNPSWVSMLRPWCENDPQRDEGDQRLKLLEADTFASRRRGIGKPSFHGVHINLPTIHAFSKELPRAVTRAVHAFESLNPAVPLPVDPGPVPTRPSLRRARPGARPGKSVSLPLITAVPLAPHGEAGDD
jgi:FxsC-like protein